MRKIGVRAFQQNFHKEMKNLPFTVTKNGEDFCVVTAPGVFVSTPLPARLPDIDILVTSAGTRPTQTTESVIRKSNVTTQKVDLEALGIKQGWNVVTLPNKPTPPLQEDGTTQDTRPTGKCQIKNVPCRAFGQEYKITYYGDEGEVVEKRYLCDTHVKATRKQGAEVVEV